MWRIKQVQVTTHIFICSTHRARMRRTYTCQIVMTSLCSLWKRTRHSRRSGSFSVTVSALIGPMAAEERMRLTKRNEISKISQNHFRDFTRWYRMAALKVYLSITSESPKRSTGQRCAWKCSKAWTSSSRTSGHTRMTSLTHALLGNAAGNSIRKGIWRLTWSRFMGSSTNDSLL